MLSHARLLNLTLRISTLGARFLFVFFLAKHLTPDAVGYYGLFSASVGYALYFVGLDFYTYANREVHQAPPEQRGRMLKGQLALSVLLYVVVTPIAGWMLMNAGWPTSLLWWFFPILVVEHLNQEISRLLITLSQQVTASALLFVRQGSWAIAIAAAMTLTPDARQLGHVMLSWFIAGLAAALIGVRSIYLARMGGWRLPLDWAWIKTGITVSAGFLIATLALRGVQTLDRYWLEALTDLSTVGTYALFIGIAGTFMVFIDATALAFAYPELMSLHQRQAHALAHRKVMRTLAYVIGCAIAFSAVSWVLLPHILDWIAQPVYQQNIWLYPWILLATVLNALGMVPHVALYARQRDRAIIASHIVAMVVFGASVWLIAQTHPLLAVPAGLVIFFSVILAYKSIAYLCMDRTTNASGLHTDAAAMQHLPLPPLPPLPIARP